VPGALSVQAKGEDAAKKALQDMFAGSKDVLADNEAKAAERRGGGGDGRGGSGGRGGGGGRGGSGGGSEEEFDNWPWQRGLLGFSKSAFIILPCCYCNLYMRARLTQGSCTSAASASDRARDAS
jgi:hypothetical protein